MIRTWLTALGLLAGSAACVSRGAAPAAPAHVTAAATNKGRDYENESTEAKTGPAAGGPG